MPHINFEQEEPAAIAELNDEEVVNVVGGILGLTELLDSLSGLISSPQNSTEIDDDGNNDVNVIVTPNALNNTNIGGISLLGGSATGGSNSNTTTNTFKITNFM